MQRQLTNQQTNQITKQPTNQTTKQLAKKQKNGDSKNFMGGKVFKGWTFSGGQHFQEVKFSV